MPRFPDLRANLRRSLVEAILSVPYVQVVQPTYFLVVAVLTQQLKIDAAAFGVIVSMPGWCALLQLGLATPIIRRWGAKRASLGFQLIDLVVWVCIPLVLFFLPEMSAAAGTAIFVLAFAVSQGVRALNRVAHPTWTRDWLPYGLRGRFFGLRNTASTMLLILIAVAVVPILERTPALTAYQWYLGLAVAVKVGSWILQARIRLPEKSLTPVARTDLESPRALSIPERWRSLLAGGRVFLPLVALVGTASVFGSIVYSFRSVYLLDVVGISVPDVGRLTLLELAVAACVFPLWASCGKRIGFPVLILIALAADAVEAMAWAILPPESTFGFYGITAWHAVFNPAFQLALVTTQVNLLPQNNAARYMSLALAFEAVGNALGPTLFGWILEGQGSTPGTYRTGFFIAGLGELMVILGIGRLLRRHGGTLSSRTQP